VLGEDGEGLSASVSDVSSSFTVVESKGPSLDFVLVPGFLTELDALEVDGRAGPDWEIIVGGS
jgi:hypothetical protein